MIAKGSPASENELHRLGGALAADLEPWFVAQHRDLSWRRTRDPYRIWVSEIMLQQTRVQTVERYWPAFVQRFPDVQALADADPQSVLQAWSGLGYYRRARLLHDGARFVVSELGGRIPCDAPSLRKIPGIGRYTAGAIASIAFDRPEPLVDGNVARVFSRVLGERDPARQGADVAEHWALAASVVGQGTPRNLAQALMELGATVCMPRSPTCLVCPVRRHCRAHARGWTDEIPAVRKKVAQPLDRWAALGVVSRKRLLLVRRPDNGILAGMWCLPLVSEGKGIAGRMEALLGAPLKAEPLDKKVRHVFTHRIWEMTVHRLDVAKRPALPGLDKASQTWVRAGHRPQGGIPSVTEKLLRSLGW